jgi:ATP-binding cassette subfamily G (WHITE) protein 2
MTDHSQNETRRKVGSSLAPDNVVNIAAVLFMWTTLPAFGAASYVPAIVLERPLFLRERADGLYSVGSYLAAKMAEELGLALCSSALFSCIVWFPLALRVRRRRRRWRGALRSL